MKAFKSLNHILVVIILSLFSCDKQDITIYNNYEGNPNDSTGYLNIFYHDFEPDIVLDSATVDDNLILDNFSLDFNNDGTADIGFKYGLKYTNYSYRSYDNYGWLTGPCGTLRNTNCIYQIPAYSLNTQDSIIGLMDGNANLDIGYLIQGITNPNEYDWLRSPESLDNCSRLMPCNSLGQDFYLGIRSNDEDIPGIRNYAWLKINISSDGKILTLKEYAYNMIPNSPIRVGDK